MGVEISVYVVYICVYVYNVYLIITLVWSCGYVSLIHSGTDSVNASDVNASNCIVCYTYKLYMHVAVLN